MRASPGSVGRDALYLGIFEGHSDPAAAIVRNGEVLAYAEEERFVRIKHARGIFPMRAVKFCLQQANATLRDIAAIALCWDVEGYTNGTMRAFFDGMARDWPIDARTRQWHQYCLSYFNADNVRRRYELQFRHEFGDVRLPPFHAMPHHYVHAVHACAQSPYERALCLTVDGSGDRHCTVLWTCAGDQITPVREIVMPHSLGWYYAAFTEYLGFDAYDGEYKVMGLAAYGHPNAVLQRRIGEILHPAPDGIEYRLNPRLIHYGARTWSERFTDDLVALLERPPRAPDRPLEPWHEDLAWAVQDALEQAAARLVRWGMREFGFEHLCIGGGVAHNVKMNSALFGLPEVRGVFPQPLCNDGGAAAGAALAACWELSGEPPRPLRTLALGNDETADAIRRALEICQVAFETPPDVAEAVADALASGAIVGWFQGRMEGGPRALGQRSILADPRSVAARDRVNAIIKYREYWRPFCPSMPVEDAGRFLKRYVDAPFMTIAFEASDELAEKAPAVVHVDGTARVQLVHREVLPLFHQLLKAFERRAGIPVLLNTSFNVRGEPIVCTIHDAVRTFFGTGLDILAAGPFLIRKQPSAEAAGVAASGAATGRHPAALRE